MRGRGTESVRPCPPGLLPGRGKGALREWCGVKAEGGSLRAVASDGERTCDGFARKLISKTGHHRRAFSCPTVGPPVAILTTSGTCGSLSSSDFRPVMFLLCSSFRPPACCRTDRCSEAPADCR